MTNYYFTGDYSIIQIKYSILINTIPSSFKGGAKSYKVTYDREKMDKYFTSNRKLRNINSC